MYKCRIRVSVFLVYVRCSRCVGKCVVSASVYLFKIGRRTVLRAFDVQDEFLVTLVYDYQFVA